MHRLSAYPGSNFGPVSPEPWILERLLTQLRLVVWPQCLLHEAMAIPSIGDSPWSCPDDAPLQQEVSLTVMQRLPPSHALVLHPRRKTIVYKSVRSK